MGEAEGGQRERVKREAKRESGEKRRRRRERKR